jgi:hypothetical protein
LAIESGVDRFGSTLRAEERPCEKRSEREAQSDPYNNYNKYGLHFVVPAERSCNTSSSNSDRTSIGLRQFLDY